MPALSSTATSILTILNNINELIVESSDRSGANDVMKALVVYAKNKRFDIPDDKINNFYAVLIDSKPYTLTNLIMDIAQDIVVIDRKKQI